MINGISSLDLNLHSQNLNPSHADYRAYGFQLRCLSEVRVALTIGRVYPNRQPLL